VILRSLRARLLIGTTAITAGALIILGLTIDVAVRHILLEEFDAAMVAKAKSLASMVEQHRKGITFEFSSDLMPEFASPRDPEYFQIWVSGKTLARSTSLRTTDLAAPPSADGIRSGWTVLPDGRHGRMVSFAFKPYIDPDERTESESSQVPCLIIVARDTLALDHTRSRLRWAAVILSAGAVSLSGIALLLLVHLSTRPVRGLTAQIASMNGQDLGARLDPRDLPSELVPIVDRLNDLLTRLAAVIERERSFTADAAHELRTPLAGLRATLEVCRSRPRDAGSYEVVLDKSLEQLAALQSLVESLLMLARADAGQVAAQREEVDLAAILGDCWATFESRAIKRQLSVQKQWPHDCHVTADRQFLLVVINNLLDNAVSHADAGGQIQLNVNEQERQVILQISNSDSRLNATDLEHIFERFWRGDASRSQTGLHAGLGLGLCQKLLKLMNGSILAEKREGMFRVTIALLRPTNASTSGTTPPRAPATAAACEVC
jgi:two-component system heavy metal sensor histidine kinase CusS